MISVEAYNQLKAYARIDGAKLGLFWVISFALFVANFAYPICGTFWMMTMIATPFVIGIYTNRFATKVLDGNISYRRAYAYSAYTSFYAALILALAQWGYFQFFDHGYVIGNYLNILTDPNVSKALEGMGYKGEQMQEIVEQLKALRPIDISLQILWTNVMASLIISLTTALFASSKKRIK